MSSSTLLELDPESLRDELGKPDPSPLLIDFWAPWCGTCKLLAPTLAKLAEAHEGDLRVGKVDVASHPDIAESYDVQGLPTLILVRSDEELVRLTELKSLAALTAAIAPHLSIDRSQIV